MARGVGTVLRMKTKRELPQENADGRWQRFVLATFAMLFLAAGILVRVSGFASGPNQVFVGGTLLKVGVVLGLAWLAAPQLARLGWEKLQGSLLVAVITVLILYAIRPRIGAIAGVVLIAGSLFFGLVGWVRSLTRP